MEMMRIEAEYRIPLDDEFTRWSNDAAALVHKYGWEDRNVYPWSYPINVLKLISEVSDAPHCTYGSKVELYQLAKGLTRIFNSWENTEVNGMTLKNLRTGKIFKIDREMGELMMEDMPGKYEVIR